LDKLSQRRCGRGKKPKVIHLEIPAEDTKRAVAFYKKALGWKFSEYGGEGMDCWLATVGEDKEPGINGAISIKGDTHPTTINTISVPSFKDVVKKINAAGGKSWSPK